MDRASYLLSPSKAKSTGTFAAGVPPPLFHAEEDGAGVTFRSPFLA